MTDKDTRNPEIDPNGPPLDWFEGRGPEGEGIEHVSASPSLTEMSGGLVGENLTEWNHVVGGTIVSVDPFRVASEASEMPEGEYRNRALIAEQIIKRETGFTPRQIHERSRELLDLFKGQTEAPFPVILWSQRKE